MKYLLDTCTISDFVRGHVNVLQRFKQTAPQHIAISTLTCMEIDYGLQLNAQRAKKLVKIIDSLLEVITILPFSKEDARAAAAVHASLKRQGNPIGAYDVLLAGCALSRGLIFVTSNTKEFKRVTGLSLENWQD